MTVFLRTKNSCRKLKIISEGTKNVGIYTKYVGEVEKNECRDEKVAAVKLTHALHLIFIFFEFWSTYGIIIHLYGHNNSPEILLINQFWFEIQ